MRLSELDHLASFALLGPGFGAGGFVLVTELTPAPAEPLLVLAPFEADPPSWVRLGGRLQTVTIELDPPPCPPTVTLDTTGYREAVETIRAAIAAGDVYQVCHTVRAVLGPGSGAALATAMWQPTVPRFAAWVRLPDGPELVSASPELLLAVDGRRVRTEPMKGTARPDGAGLLAASEKDSAELAMITDLLRHDLAPVCVPRSVRVTCPRRFVALPYAWQTVSEVAGELAPGVTPLDALAAVHPGGSVTGAPKTAALEMIHRLEKTPRGVYCGALGLREGERWTFSLLIRTASRTLDGWLYGVGSGIVYDSDPHQELLELHVKLGALGCHTPFSA